MSDERFERELSELLDADEVAPALPKGWEQRASERLAAVRMRDPGPRFRWQTVAVAALVVAALGVIPYSADTARAPALGAMVSQQAAEAAEGPGAQASTEPTSPKTYRDDYLDEATRKELASYRRRAAAFVREGYPNDPEMLMAAGLLAEDESAGLTLLKEVAETANTPVAWAAYVSRLLEQGPRYERLGTYGVDPGDQKMITRAERDLADVGLPTALSEQQAQPLLTAAKRWQEQDRRNALPVAIEVWSLYGLHRDEEAFGRWKAAGRLEVVTAHGQEMARAEARLLSRMGMPPLTSISTGLALVPLPGYGPLRTCTRVASYEGGVAQMQGRAADAITWWNSTIAIGRHMQESATDLIDYLVGVAVEGIGAAPTWKWYPGAATGMEDGPLLKGRCFWGPQHEFYVSQVGEAADRQVRDDLVLTKVRQMAHRRLGEPFLAISPAIAWMKPLSGAMVCAFALVMLLALFLAVGVWRRRQADEATALSNRWRASIVSLTLLAVFGGAALAAAWVGLVSREEGLRLLYLGGPVVSFLLALGLSLVAAVRSRRPGARLVTAWRGNLRATLLVSVAACAVAVLGLAATVKVMRGRAVAEWYRGSPTEMQRLVQLFGPRWTNPQIPPDSWRAEYPPEVKPER